MKKQQMGLSNESGTFFILLAISLFVSFLLAGCGNSDGSGSSSQNVGTHKVEITFEWSASNNTANFGPFPGNAHFSPFVAVTHKAGSAFYEVGKKASAGVKSVAETGSTVQLLSEIKTQKEQGKALGHVQTSGASLPFKTLVFTIDATDSFHHLSLISMIAPSPDWFIAFANLNLKDTSGNWIDKLENVELRGYDAGTDGGATFTAGNAVTSPPENILRFTGGDDIVFAKANVTRL